MLLQNATSRALCLAASAVLLASLAHAELSPAWVARLPLGSSLGAGTQGMVVDASGVSYVTAITGPSSNNDILTAAFAADGRLLWSHVYNGPANWHDQARGIALGPDGTLFVTGNTPGPGMYSDVLLLEYDATSGELLDTLQYASAPFTSEHGASVAVDTVGNVYIAGGTVGDGADALILKVDPNGVVQWQQIWDGPAFGPYSQDHARGLRIDPGGDVVVMLHGVMNTLHPDYVVVKYAPADGSVVWQASWGVAGGDFANDFAIDALGDIYVTGTGLDFTDKFSTIKLRGSDGGLLWQAYDAGGIDDTARAIALDAAGGVYVTGSVDPDGDLSNFNNRFYTVKRRADDGSLLWTHAYGESCVGCLDTPSDVAVDPAGNVFVAGSTSSPPYSAIGDTITFVLDAATGLERKRGVIPSGTPDGAGSGFLAFNPAHDLINAGQVSDPNTGAVELSVCRYDSLVPRRQRGEGSRRTGTPPAASRTLR